MKEWNDEKTGRTVRQLTTNPQGTRMLYFRMQKRLPGGLMMTISKHSQGNVVVFSPETGEMQELPITAERYLRVRESDGRLWYQNGAREIWHVDLPYGQPELDIELAEDVPGSIADITCDGSTIILDINTSDFSKYHAPHGTDLVEFWKYFHERKRDGKLFAYEIASGKLTQLLDWKGKAPNHMDASPVDPSLLKFCSDDIEFETQRIWAVCTDGSDLRKIRPTEEGEMITHEFWSHEATLIGYTYQDRRGDPTKYLLPWAEYSPMETQIGFSNTKGEEIYLSDPVNHHHSHVITSPDGNWISGEGTDHHEFVYLAALDLEKTRIRYFPIASLQGSYTPLAGQQVDADFTADSNWMVYTNNVEGVPQICAVRTQL